MIASDLMFPQEPVPTRRLSPAITAREATRRRKAAQRKRYYRDCLQIGLISVAIVLSVVGYLVLITRSTALDDRLLVAQAKRGQLQEDLVMYQDRRASLEARDRLSTFALHMGFKEHPKILVVDVPPAILPDNPSPFFGALASWFHLR